MQRGYTMTDLITRLREAKEGSRELDAAIGRALTGTNARKGHWYDLFGKWTPDETVPAFTTDLSAAVALAERVLPGWVIRLDIFTEDGVTNACVGALWRGDVKHKTPALALCLAILTAKAEPNQ